MTTPIRYTGAYTPFPRARRVDGMCPEHRARLAAIRESMNGQGRYHQKVEQRGYRPPKCCNPSCGSRRPRGSRYCVECVDAGWEEPE